METIQRKQPCIKHVCLECVTKQRETSGWPATSDFRSEHITTKVGRLVRPNCKCDRLMAGKKTDISQLLIQDVPFILSLSKAVLLHRKPASAGKSRDSCSNEWYNKKNSV